MERPFLPNPEPGYVLVDAVLTTFDFDGETFLSWIEGEDPSKFILFRGDGLYGGDTAGLCLTKLAYPPIDGKISEKYFHPKVGLFRYEGQDGTKRYRLRIGSKNIYPFDNHEIEIEFEGVSSKDEQPANHPIIGLLEFLSSSMEDVTKKRQVDIIAKELNNIRFRPLDPYSCHDYEFVTKDVGSFPDFQKPYDEMLVVSPNITPAQLEHLYDLRKEGGRCFVFTNPATLRDLLSAGVDGPCYLSLPLEKYVHAKAFLIRRNGRYDLYAGSMNLTDYALTKNEEAMVYLRDVADIQSVADFLHRLLSLPKETIETEINQYEDLSREGGFIEKTTSIQTRISYAHHLLQGQKYDVEEKAEAVATLLSSQMKSKLETLLSEEELDLLPLKRIIPSPKKTRVAYLLPFFDNLALGCVNHSLHRYDDLFSPNVYLHVAGRGPLGLFKRIHQDESFPNLHFYRTDIHDFDPSMDETVLLEKIQSLFENEPEVAAFLCRYVRHRDYRLEEGTIYHDGPAQYTGLPLGGFLENVYLTDFDKTLERRSAFYARCGDDILIGAHSKEEIDELATLVPALLGQRKLTQSKTKTSQISPKNPFVFLGWKIENGEIDFTDEYLTQLAKGIRIAADKLLRLHHKKPFSLITAIKLVNSHIQKTDILSSFKVITVDTGLRRIDRMAVEFIRTLTSGSAGKKKYRITQDTLRSCGYQTLVNAYYRFIRR